MDFIVAGAILTGGEISALVGAVVAVLLGVAAILQAQAASTKASHAQGAVSAASDVHQSIQSQLDTLNTKVAALNGEHTTTVQ